MGNDMNNMTDDELDMVAGGTKIVIRVAEGDTLSALAKKFNCTVDDICKWNDIKDPNKIDIGQKLMFKF